MIEGRERFGVDYNIIARSFDPLQRHQRCARCRIRPRQSCPALALAADKWLDYQKRKGSSMYEGESRPVRSTTAQAIIYQRRGIEARSGKLGFCRREGIYI